MKGPESLLILCCLLGVRAAIVHEDIYIGGCSGRETGGEAMFGLDGEEIWYADFKHKTGVEPQPPFIDHMSVPGGYQAAVGDLEICRQNLKIIQSYHNNTEVETDAPHSTIYTRDVVEIGGVNHLICHVTGFYPAPVKVYWTKNNENVTEGTNLNTPFPNKDGTFNQFSSLSFTPQLGDIYSCTVEHRALSQPLTQVWGEGP